MNTKRRGGVSWGLLAAFALVMFNLGRDAHADGVVTQLSLGIHAGCLALIGLGLALVREKADPGQLWPEDLDDVWPEEADTTGLYCGSQKSHGPHEYIHTSEAGTEPVQCPGGAFYDSQEESTETLKPVPDEAWCPERSVHAEHFFEFAGDTFRCPGKETFVPAEVIQGGLAEPLPGYPPEPEDLDPEPCANRRFHAAHDGCPGRSGRRKAAASGT